MTTKREKAEQFANETYQIHVTGRNVLVTDAMKDYAIEKVAKIERFSDRIIDVQITMDIQKLEHRVDILMKVGHTLIRSHGVGNDMYGCIDRAVHKLERQLKRYKRRIQDHAARPLEMIDMRVNVYRAPEELEVEEVNDAIIEETNKKIEEELKPHEIVAEDTMPLKVLTADEAIMKMELSGDSFLLYRDEASRKLKLIYRRKDGNFGLVHPEG